MTGKRNPMAQHFLTLTSVSCKCSYKLNINILKQIKDTMLFSRFLTCFWRLKYLGKNYTLLTIEKSQRRIPTIQHIFSPRRRAQWRRPEWSPLEPESWAEVLPSQIWRWYKMAWWHADLSHLFFPIIMCGCLEEATVGRREVLPRVKVFLPSYGKAFCSGCRFWN